jgi:hypothetical protein
MLNDLRDSLIVVINRYAGCNENSGVSTTSVVSKTDSDQLVALLVSELVIRCILDVGDELFQSVDIFRRFIRKSTL